MTLKRRALIKAAALTSVAALIPTVGSAATNKSSTQRVVVIGGGFAGATAAKYMAMWSPNTEVILIERNAQFISCPQSNLVLAGSRTLAQLTHDYHGLAKNYGVKIIQRQVVAINSAKQSITLDDATELAYHRLVLAPGIDFIYDQLPELMDPQVQQRIPHAWKAGSQTRLLQQQLMAMKPGGTMIMTVPATPFRCPPGPYERACQIAYYLKNNNPRAKLIILDANADIVAKKGLFKQTWQYYYPDFIEYVPNSFIESIDPENLTVETEFDRFSADVLNFIPDQKAGSVAEMAGVINVDNRWSKVDFLTYESTAQANVHVIGDAVHAKLPKSGHIANAQAKVCAAAIVALLADKQPEQQPVFNNTCYSFIDDKQAMHVAAVYRYDKQQQTMIAMPGSGVSEQASQREGDYAYAWANNIWHDMLR